MIKTTSNFVKILSNFLSKTCQPCWQCRQHRAFSDRQRHPCTSCTGRGGCEDGPDARRVPCRSLWCDVMCCEGQKAGNWLHGAQRNSKKEYPSRKPRVGLTMVEVLLLKVRLVVWLLCWTKCSIKKVKVIVSQTTADNRWMCKYEYMNKSDQVEQVVS